MTFVMHTNLRGECNSVEFPKKCRLPSSRIQLVVGIIWCILFWGYRQSSKLVKQKAVKASMF